jgi:hypothetical protein
MRNLLMGFIVFLIVPLSEACSSSKKYTDKELFIKANSVFRARIVETKIVQFRNPDNLSEVGEVVEAKFEIKEIFKGAPPRSGIVRDIPYGIGNCSLGLLAGVEYVFFPGENDSVLLLSGSFGFINPDAPEMKRRLDELRNWGRKISVREVGYGEVADSER